MSNDGTSEPGHAGPGPADELLARLGEVADESGPALARAWEELSDGYRRGEGTPAGRRLSAAHVRAYAVARAPATLAAVRAGLDAVRARRPGWAPATVLDLGAGLGVATWAAAATFPTLRHAELVERSPAMAELGRRLAAGAGDPVVRAAAWTAGDAAAPRDRRADLVVASYVLSELDASTVPGAVAAWWAATAGDLVVVDTGTPAGFARIRRARDLLLAAGATLTAPCPDDGPCPMAGDDWCHFAARLHRTAAHRHLKGAALGHEDEKFSYVAASRQPPAHAAGRVLRRPQVRSGHVRLTVCHGGEAATLVVPRSRRAAHRWARGAAWGDAVPPEALDGPR